MFIGRKSELASLAEEFGAARPSLVIIYGRRRVGKSELIREAAQQRPHVIYQATRVASSLNLEACKTEVARSLGDDPLLAGIGDWLSLLHYLARSAERVKGLTFALDEFPYLSDAEPALQSVIQKFWDSDAPRSGNLKLVLCGSMIAHMEDLLAERNPLYGRKTMTMDLRQLSVRDAQQFFPRYTPEDRLMAYAVFGGVPYYLQLCDPDATLEDNIVRLLLSDTGPLLDEPTVLLQAELRDIQRYASILWAIASGCTKYGEIIGRVKEFGESGTLGQYIEKLERMRLIRIVRSIDASPKERDRRYFIAEPLVGFWHRFVRPNLSSIAEGFGRDVWRHQIRPRLPEFMGAAFEDICRDHARRHSQERLPAPAQEIGRIWHGDYDLDIAGRLLDGAMLFGECKWSDSEIGEGVLEKLIERSALTSYGRGEERRYFALYAKKGFTEAVRKRSAGDPSIVLHTPDTILGTRRKPSKRPSRARHA
ncbi:MAG TPA: ATP-binding protein [Gemmataceae bacterium]|nr:ATP-binding protein [Gemmataceae bacterium]